MKAIDRKPWAGLALAGVLLTSALLNAGCDASVTPVSGTEQPFSLFGVLSPQLDTQKVLVFPIEPTLRILPDEPLDAAFTSEALAGGAAVVWRDSILRPDSGGVVHMFWAPFQAEYDRAYRIRVADAAGTASTVDVAVPPTSEIEVETPANASTTVVPILIRGDVPNLLKVEMVYGFDYEQIGLGEKVRSLSLPYDEQASRVDDGWLIRVNLSRDYRTILDFIRSQRPIELARGISLEGIQLRFIAANAEWSPPEGVFDPDVLVQPGTMSNVMNGFGFVGAGYRTSFNWLPPDDNSRAAGFRD